MNTESHEIDEHRSHEIDEHRSHVIDEHRSHVIDEHRSHLIDEHRSHVIDEHRSHVIDEHRSHVIDVKSNYVNSMQIRWKAFLLLFYFLIDWISEISAELIGESKVPRNLEDRCISAMSNNFFNSEVCILICLCVYARYSRIIPYLKTNLSSVRFLFAAALGELLIFRCQ